MVVKTLEGQVKALTVHGVWAWCIMHAGKNVENRSWTPPLKMIGSRFAIHAGQNPGDPQSRAAVQQRYEGPDSYPKGTILGTVMLKGFVDGDDYAGITAKEARQIARSKWAAAGNCWWVLGDPQVLADPLPCKGALGLWNVPDSIASHLYRRSQQPADRMRQSKRREKRLVLLH